MAFAPAMQVLPEILAALVQICGPSARQEGLHASTAPTLCLSACPCFCPWLCPCPHSCLWAHASLWRVWSGSNRYASPATPGLSSGLHAGKQITVPVSDMRQFQVQHQLLGNCDHGVPNGHVYLLTLSLGQAVHQLVEGASCTPCASADVPQCFVLMPMVHSTKLSNAKRPRSPSRIPGS